MTSLETLNVASNGISSLPDSLYGMSSLTNLYANDNDIGSLSSDIDGLSSLEMLDVSGNDLQHLPGAICDIPSLDYLIVTENRLYDLPSDIGHTNIKALYANNNRISKLPSSIGSSSMFDLNMAINRLTELPSTFDDKSYDFLNIEFNFLDVTPGSPALALIDNTTAGAFDWERQFMAVTNLTAAATDTEITLTWDACTGGSDGGATWTVDSYIVYLHDDGLDELADLTPTDLTYTHSGLSPLESHEYWVGVTYHLVFPGPSIDM